MTAKEMITTVKALLDNDPTATDELVEVYLNLSQNKILARLYPYGFEDEAEVPSRYHLTQCELAMRLFLRRGGEGENAHAENGVSRQYPTVDDSDILNRVVPFAKVV